MYKTNTILYFYYYIAHRNVFSTSEKYFLTIWVVSKERIILVSSGGQRSAPDTLVPPPNGIITTSYLWAKLTKDSTSSLETEN